MSTQVLSTMSRPMTTPILVFSWTCRIVAAIILLQTLFFKFTAAPESVYIFTKLGAFIHTYLPFASIGTVELSARSVLCHDRLSRALHYERCCPCRYPLPPRRSLPRLPPPPAPTRRPSSA